jgi:hypothetical protein
MTPQLSFDQHDNRWELRLPDDSASDERSYLMQIQYAWDDNVWSHFRFFVWDCGTRVELVTKEQYEERVRSIDEHEGEGAGHAWHLEQTDWEVVRDNHPVFALRDHWNAMMTLGLFTPSVTL